MVAKVSASLINLLEKHYGATTAKFATGAAFIFLGLMGLIILVFGLMSIGVQILGPKQDTYVRLAGLLGAALWTLVAFNVCMIVYLSIRSFFLRRQYSRERAEREAEKEKLHAKYDADYLEIRGLVQGTRNTIDQLATRIAAVPPGEEGRDEMLGFLAQFKLALPAEIDAAQPAKVKTKKKSPGSA